MKYKIYKYKDLNGNDFYKITKSSNLFKLSELFDRIFIGPLCKSKYCWVNSYDSFF